MKNATAYDERTRSMAGTNSYSIMNKKISEKNNDGVSPVIATVLLVAITVILCGIVAAISMPFINQLDEQPPEIYAIVYVNHWNDTTNSKTWASNITVKNNGIELLWNSAYKPVFYNGSLHKTPTVINLTARGSTTGLGSISGPGPNGDVWLPKTIGYLDLTDGTIKNKTLLRLDIIRISDGKVISRSVRLIDENFFKVFPKQ